MTINMKKNKNGELTTQQIVFLIILVISFVILLYFLIKLNLGAESEKEVCHNSVVLRSNKLIPTESVPLKCETQYICITQDGSCEQMLGPEKIKVKTSYELYQAVATELTDCWWMFGEGELNYVGSDTFPEMYCSFCSQIAFDNSVQEISDFKSGEFDKENLYKFMAENKMKGKEETYSEYLYGTNNYKSFLNVQNASKVSFGKINLDNQYKVLMGITSKASTISWTLIGAGAVAFGALTGGAGYIVLGIAAASGGAAGYFVLSPVAQNSWGGNVIPPSLIESPSEELNSIGCKNIDTLS